MPVKLISFTANLDQDQSKVNLDWITATEINANHFVIERSTDGNTFSDVGTVFAVGTTSEQKNYRFADNISLLNARVIYYRLRKVDIDGRAEYSSTRIIRTGKQSDNATIMITAYPNPVSNELRITIPAEWQGKMITYTIINANGQVSKKVETDNSSQTEIITVNSLAPGFYIVRAGCDGQTSQQKIVKQ